ncbi:MAG: hypothetical protein H0T75_10440 [Rhizobiales bacterium]|nr:hypothetical protein [Hyphomicrobiales bacterium]
MLDRDIVAEVKASKHVTAEQVLVLRRWVYNGGAVVRGEIDKLFAVDEAATEHDAAWCELFTEAVSDYLVDQVEPEGYVDEENADWLISRISQDGAVKTATELELLVKVLEKAKSSPERLAAFALSQVAKAIIGGDGPLARGGRLEAGRVTRDKADLMRRILYAFGGDGNLAVSRAEAEILFDINDAAAAADNDPAWSDLFVKAIASFLMAASGYAVPSRQEAIRREAWLDEPAGGVADFFGRMAAGSLRGVLQSYREPEGEGAWAARNARLEANSSVSEVVTAEEAEWLARRIGRDGALHANEKALLRFIRDEAPSVHPSLRTLIAKAA